MKSSLTHRRHGYKSRSKRGRLTRLGENFALPSLSKNLVAIAVLWAALLLLGGSSRGDVAQLIILRPLAVLIACFGLWTLRKEHLSRYPFLLAMTALIILVAVLHLLPLPPSLWHGLPGRELLVAVDEQAQLKDIWRPLTMAPAMGWNALLSLVVPFAVLINGIQLSRNELVRLGPFVIAGGLASAVLALFQLFSTPNGALYFYSIRVSDPQAVGLFANRNHQGLLLATMFPLLAAFAARLGVSAIHDRRRIITATAIGVFLIPLLIVTGSRAGFGAGLLGLAATPLILARGELVRRSDRSRFAWWKYAVSGVVVLAIIGLSVATNRSIAIQRSLASLTEEDQRYGRWSVIADNYSRFLPVGSGVGSYEPVFQTFEPRSTLTPTYSNHAHNDWLEVIMTVGIPGAILLFLAILAFIIAAIRHFRLGDRGITAAYRRAGLVIIALIAAASFVDYPIRTPIIGAMMVIACLWAAADCRASDRAGEVGADRLH